MTSEPAPLVGNGAAAESAALAKIVARQRAELDRLREAAATSAVLERAKGALMASTGCSPEAAHEQLVLRAGTARRTLLEECWLTLGALMPTAPPAEPPSAGPASRETLTAPGTAETLGRLGLALVRVGSPQDLAGCLLEHLAPEIGADAVFLYRRGTGDGLELVGHAGVDATLAAQWQRIPPLSGIAPLEALRSGEPLWLEDVAKDREEYQLIGEFPERWSSRAWLPVPAGATARVALGVLRRTAGAFDPAARELLRAVARLWGGRRGGGGAAAAPARAGGGPGGRPPREAPPGGAVRR
ncbi:GAF and ANTAR domain-containing protein, partial [Streptomyces sp. NPDC004237]|uniref:GAF and ANTAR domain-containing protein n=1 Tax=Streptomyces sp. NPDC004237 TaxID=3154455 RepID=UPI00339DA9B7